MMTAVRAFGMIVAGFMALIAGQPATAAEVKLALNFTWQGTYMPLLYGQSKGYFKDADISLEITPMQGSNQALQMIESGRVDYAFLDSDTFLAAAAQGKSDSVAVYVWLDKPTLDIVSTTALPNLRAMSGRSFATTGFSASRTVLPYILKANDIDPKTVEIQSFDFSVLYPSLFRGAVDTAESRMPGSWQNLLAQAREQNKQLYLLHLSDYGLEGYDKLLLVRRAKLRSSPAEVKALVSAMDRSLKQAIANASDDETYNLLKDLLPQARRGPLVADWHDYKNLVKNPGPIDPKIFESSLKRLHEVGTINQIPPVQNLYQNP
jgi:NitT/TauT family transport system substrate-binding protein